MRTKDLIWMGDENRKRKHNMTQRKCLERTGKQVIGTDQHAEIRLGGMLLLGKQTTIKFVVICGYSSLVINP